MSRLEGRSTSGVTMYVARLFELSGRTSHGRKSGENAALISVVSCVLGSGGSGGSGGVGTSGRLPRNGSVSSTADSPTDVGTHGSENWMMKREFVAARLGFSGSVGSGVSAVTEITFGPIASPIVPSSTVMV